MKIIRKVLSQAKEKTSAKAYKTETCSSTTAERTHRNEGENRGIG